MMRQDKRILNRRHALIILLVLVISSAFIVGALYAMGKAEKGIESMSEKELIELALSAAPRGIAEKASVMIPGEGGRMIEVKRGTNGFTCIPTVNNRPEPDPMCMDEAVGQWVSDLVSKNPRPTNTVPGISYMARGGWHWEKDGIVLMDEEPGAMLVKEPPHWMLMWPFDSKLTGLPTAPNPSGVWIMFDGTPFAHLMVYQDPSRIR